MDSQKMERLFKNLGSSYDALVANGVIENLPLQDLYEEGVSLEVEPGPGIELIFWPETNRFEGIYLTLRDDQRLGIPVFAGQLPEPFGSLLTQEDVHAKLGDPMFSKGALELQGTGLTGWDTYQLKPQFHPAALIDFQYSGDLNLSKIFVALIDRHI